MQFQLQGRTVSARFGGLENAVEHIVPDAISALLWPRVASVIRQQGVRHQVDRLGSIGGTLKEHLRLHEVKPLQDTSKENIQLA